MKRSRGFGYGWFELIFFLIVVVIGFGIPVAGCAARNMNPRLASFKVKRVTETADRGGRYLVFTETDDVYQNEDAWFYGKWDSSDLQSQMDPGECYRAKVTGYRIRFMSWYPNIIELYPCDKDQ